MQHYHNISLLGAFDTWLDAIKNIFVCISHIKILKMSLGPEYNKWTEEQGAAFMDTFGTYVWAKRRGWPCKKFCEDRFLWTCDQF